MFPFIVLNYSLVNPSGFYYGLSSAYFEENISSQQAPLYIHDACQ